MPDQAPDLNALNANVVATTLRVMRLSLLGVPLMLVVLALSVRTGVFWWGALCYGFSIAWTGYGLTKQEQVLLLVARAMNVVPERRRWLRPLAYVLFCIGVGLFTMGLWHFAAQMGLLA